MARLAVKVRPRAARTRVRIVLGLTNRTKG
jgi:hypothetical protein